MSFCLATARYHIAPYKALAFIDNNFVSFFPSSPWHHLEGHSKIAHLLYHWPQIEAKIREQKRGTCWRVPCDAKRVEGKSHLLHLSKAALQQLKIPADVIKAHHKAKAAR